MIGASLYIISRSAWNRARIRIRRLREPRYLLGGIVGVAYFYFSFFRFPGGRRSSRRRRPDPETSAILATFTGAGVTLVALLLALGAALTWLVPTRGTLFEFSKAEVQFLFPAPMRRRQILLHRLMRSQLGLLFASVVPALIVPRGSGGSRVRFAIAVWIMLVTMRLLSTGTALARSRLNHHDRRSRFMARLFLAATCGGILTFLLAAGREFLRTPDLRFLDFIGRVNDIAHSGVGGVLLWPFAALAAPVFATDWLHFGTALGGALLVLTLAAVWVFASEEAFEAASDAVVEGGERRSRVPVAKYRVRSTAFTLQPLGRPELAFVWKAATEAVRVVNLRTVFRIAIPLLATIAIAVASGRLPRGVSEIFAILTLMSVAFSTLMGPQALRTDLRQDLEHIALLKTWPVSPGAVIRGEMLWPVSLLTLIAWTLVLAAVFIVPVAFPLLTPVWRVALGGAVMLVAPGLIAAQYVIHNAAALYFPAWMTFGSQRPRGFDAMGQRLILMAGTWLVLIVMTLPGAIAAGLLWLVFSGVIGPLVLIPAALVCAAALLTEAVVATELLAPVYARVDFTDVERSE